MIGWLKRLWAKWFGPKARTPLVKPEVDHRPQPASGAVGWLRCEPRPETRRVSTEVVQPTAVVHPSTVATVELYDPAFYRRLDEEDRASQIATAAVIGLGLGALAESYRRSLQEPEPAPAPAEECRADNNWCDTPSPAPAPSYSLGCTAAEYGGDSDRYSGGSSSDSPDSGSSSSSDSGSSGGSE